MKEILGEYGIEVVEILRKKEDGVEISASRVRACMVEGDYETIRQLVPQTTFDFLVSDEGQKIAEKLAKEKKNGWEQQNFWTV